MKYLWFHLQQQYDAHLAAMSATGFSLFSGISNRIDDLIWAVITGVVVFLSVQLVKKLLKLK